MNPTGVRFTPDRVQTYPQLGSEPNWVQFYTHEPSGCCLRTEQHDDEIGQTEETRQPPEAPMVIRRPHGPISTETDTQTWTRELLALFARERALLDELRDVRRDIDAAFGIEREDSCQTPLAKSTMRASAVWPRLTRRPLHAQLTGSDRG